MTATHVVSIVFADRLATLNRALGMLRRRNLAIRSLVVGPAPDGHTRLIVTLHTDQATADRLAQLFRGVPRVREATAYAAQDAVARELALIEVALERAALGGTRFSTSSDSSDAQEAHS